MQRRTLLKLGLGSAAVLAVAAGGLAWLHPGIENGKLSPAGRGVFEAVARAVLDGVLPVERSDAEQALAAHLGRMEGTIAALPAHARGELSQLLAILAAPPGRLTLAGLATPWDRAEAAELQASLRAMRDSALTLRQQAYHALRDLTNAAYFSDPSAWPALSYPGPRAI